MATQSGLIFGTARYISPEGAAGEPTDDLYRDAQSKIDTAVSKGVLHPSTAARKKSRLAASIK